MFLEPIIYEPKKVVNKDGETSSSVSPRSLPHAIIGREDANWTPKNGWKLRLGCVLGVIPKFSEKHSRHFHMVSPLGDLYPGEVENTLLGCEGCIRNLVLKFPWISSFQLLQNSCFNTYITISYKLDF